MLKLKSQLDILHVWNIEIHPEKKITLQETLHNLFQFTVTSDKMIKICNDVNTMQRETDWGFFSLDFRTRFALTQILPLGWLTNWKNLFVVSNEKNQ